MSRYNYGGWAPYVSVAERRTKAGKMMDKLRKQGVDIQPVPPIAGRIIARSFWGKGWCEHLDSFGDYANRLDRGKTYVRNGSVCHLAIGKGKVDAIVSGSSLYNVEIQITPLAAADWAALRKQCAGRIGSLLELLQGRLSGEIMSVVTDRNKGLFPKPTQIQYKCNCPDYAGMCKHIAAVIYGIGARLDDKPQLLFQLRGVDHEELIDADAAAAATVSAKTSPRTRRRALADQSLEDVFGVELEQNAESAPTPARKSAARIAEPTAVRKTAAFLPTGPAVARLRRSLGLSKAAFAREIGVSQPTISNWEAAKGAIQPHAANLEALRRLHAKSSNHQDAVGK
jgi:uncharacterized Zn finger protein